MTLSALQRTGVGATVNSLRKVNDAPEIAEQSTRLVKGWKAILQISGREMDESTGVVDASGKRPATGAPTKVGSSSSSSTHPDHTHSSTQVNHLRQAYAVAEEKKRAHKLQVLDKPPAPPGKRPRGR